MTTKPRLLAAAGAIATAVGLYLTVLVTPFSPRILLGGAVIVLLVFLVAFWGTRARFVLGLATFVTLVSLIIAILVARPSSSDRVVDRYFAETQTANIWVGGPPLLFEGSKNYLKSNFAEFDPSTFRGWNDLPRGAAVSIPDLIYSAGMYSGGLVATAGVVNGSNDLGLGEVVVQLVPLDAASLPTVRASNVSRSLMPDDGDLDAALAGTPRDGQDSRWILYCRITPRPFAAPVQDELWFVKGVVIAYGQTLRGDGTISRVTYMACETFERGL